MSSESQLGGSWAETGGKERLSLVGGRHVCVGPIRSKPAHVNY